MSEPPHQHQLVHKQRTGPFAYTDHNVPWPGPGYPAQDEYHKKIEEHCDKVMLKFEHDTPRALVKYQKWLGKARERLLPFGHDFAQRLAAIMAQFPSGVVVAHGEIGAKMEALQQRDEALRLLIRDIKFKLGELGIDDCGYLPDFFTDCLVGRVDSYRGIVNYTTDENDRISNLRLLLERTNAALPLLDLWNVLSLWGDANYSIPEAAAEAMDEFPAAASVRWVQASAYFALGKHGAAQQALELLHAFVRVRGEAHEGEMSESNVVMLSLRNECLLAQRKKKGVRPLFTKVERNDLMQYFGVGEYDAHNLKCRSCGALGQDVDLWPCDRGCSMRWYCSEACIDEDWPDHEEECKLFNDKDVFAGYMAKCVIDPNATEENKDGFCVGLENFFSGIFGDGISDIYMCEHFGPMAIMYDYNKKVFFECFSDVELSEDYVEGWTPENTEKCYRSV